MTKKSQSRTILVQDIQITVSSLGEEDFISLTDMVKGFEGGDELIKRWLQNQSTIEFLSTWEQINNPSFNLVEFHQIRSNIGSNRFIMSTKKWLETGAIGLQAKAGRYGGTYAHRDIAFEFGSWLSPEFKLYLIKEFQRLKADEADRSSQEWLVNRELAKVNYRIQTDAIQQNLLEGVPPSQQGYTYANEADMINAIVFGKTKAMWAKENPELKGNPRDHATIAENALVAALEAQNGVLIAQKIPPIIRARTLEAAAKVMRPSLEKSPTAKRLQSATPKAIPKKNDET